MKFLDNWTLKAKSASLRVNDGQLCERLRKAYREYFGESASITG